jgi:hypothetical protein
MQASIQYTPIIGPTVDKVGLHLNFLYMPNWCSSMSSVNRWRPGEILTGTINHSRGVLHGSEAYRKSLPWSFKLDGIWRRIGALFCNWKCIKWFRLFFLIFFMGAIDHALTFFYWPLVNYVLKICLITAGHSCDFTQFPFTLSTIPDLLWQVI